MNVPVLLKAGFPLEKIKDGVWEQIPPLDTDERFLSVSQVESLSSYLSSIHESNLRDFPEKGVFAGGDIEEEEENFTSDSSSVNSDELELDDDEYRSEMKNRFRIQYADPFKVNAAVVYAHERGLKAPHVHVWTGDVITLSDKIPANLIKTGYSGKHGIPFHDLRSFKAKCFVLFNKTYWGKYLSSLAHDQGNESFLWAKRLTKRIKFFLAGKHDPRWKNSEIIANYGSRDYKLRETKSRASRLLQVLMTVDGIFQQRWLANPSEAWTWEKFDMFTLGMLSWLLPDEFYDGIVEEKSLLKTVVGYSQLKSCRQLIKRFSNLGRIPDLLEGSSEFSQNPFSIVFRETLLVMMQCQDETQKLIMRGILQQTRGAGTPPPLVCLQAKADLLDTLTLESVPLGKTQRLLVRGAVRKIIDNAPDDAFTGLQTKAGISLSSSSCYENTRAEGGTIGAINDLVYEGSLGRNCIIRDLVSGEYTCEKNLTECTPGEYIFWRSLEEVLSMQPEELSRVFLVVANEPGKARSVTKSHACLKMVLDTINGICSWPLGKAYESSTSGMSKEAHAWNAFRSFFSERKSKLLFDVVERTTSEEVDGSRYETDYYRDVFVLSTDYKTATDFILHEVAEIVGVEWMRKCGIPPILQGIVVATCYKARKVDFTAEGVLSTYGVPGPKEGTRTITTCRGVMMGDPLTKVVLHLINISVRELANGVQEHSWLSSVVDNPQELVDQIDELSAPKRIGTPLQSG
jgi:hypothetical protein